MEVKNICIVDTETNGLGPMGDPPNETDSIIEIGAVLWSVEHACVLGCFSELIYAAKNDAVSANGIPAASLVTAIHATSVVHHLREMAKRADVAMAHNAKFDRAFLKLEFGADEGAMGKPWICSMDDLEWPRPSSSRALTSIAIAHGVGVVQAHRALTDCMLIARLLERCVELGTDVQAMLQRGMRPKKTYRAVVSYENRKLAKDARFSWDAEKKTWTRRMAEEDVSALPFKCVEVPS